jgi:hypothetical protein
MMTAKFSLGQILSTPAALEVIGKAGQDASFFLDRHLQGDWGDVDDEDKQANDDALIHGARLLSAYRTLRGKRLWIITEADRSATTLLLPEEY